MDPQSLALLEAQDECTLIWLTQDGSPTGTIVSYFAADDRLWMTALAQSPRCRALTRDPRATVTISGKGTALGHARCVTLRGHVSILRDDTTRDWFFPRFAAAVLPDSERSQVGMVRAMNSPANVVLEFAPQKVIPYDSHEQMVAANRR
jgi:general stress protein 26